MAECVIIRRGKAKADPEADAQAYKAGDVVCIKPDGWTWSERELTNPDWRIVRFARCSVEDLAALVRPEMDTTGQSMRLRRRRAASINEAKLPAGIRPWWDDDTRATAVLVSNIARNTVLGYITEKTPRQMAVKVFD